MLVDSSMQKKLTEEDDRSKSKDAKNEEEIEFNSDKSITKSEESINYRHRVYNPQKMVGWMKKNHEVINQKPHGGAQTVVNINRKIEPRYRVTFSDKNYKGQIANTRKGSRKNSPLESPSMQ